MSQIFCEKLEEAPRNKYGFNFCCAMLCLYLNHEVVSSGGAPTPAGTSVFSKHNWDMGMGYLWLNGWDINHLMGGAFIGIMT